MCGVARVTKHCEMFSLIGFLLQNKNEMPLQEDLLDTYKKM